tara:strand:- start:215 stop:1318 length:1104 start_codon:yes stop_codon:yes gene_type:complete
MNAKKIVLPLIALAAIGGAAYYGFYWLTDGRYHEETDNAYLHADQVAISPKVSGYIDRLLVENNQTVKKGDLLMVIGDEDYQAKYNQAKAAFESRMAALDTMDKQIDLQQASIDQAAANLAIAKVDLKTTGEDFDRYKDLVKRGAASRQKYDYAVADRNKAVAQVNASKATLAVQQGQLEVLKAQKIEAERAVSEAGADLDLAQQTLDDTRIFAPFSGVIGNRSVQLGALVQPGEQLLVLVPLPGVYAVANFKETQIGHIAPGQKVTLEVDAFPDTEITGVIDSFAPGTGAQFSLLPPENATGNFTKITQRVPVRIKLDPSPVADALRPGLSVVVDVDVRDASGDMHASGTGLAPNQALVRDLSELQ